MEIQVQQTPNPNALKFILPAHRFPGPLNASVDDVKAGDVTDDLARRLLALEPVYNVFMVQDFVTVNKLPDVPWEPLSQQVRQILDDHFSK